MFNNNDWHLGTLRSHQCQGFHATPANTPTLWGGSSSSTKFPNESWRPPTPSFPPHDVRTLHFVACGRPLLYMVHMIHMRRSRKTVGHIFVANLRSIHLLYMICDTYGTWYIWYTCGKVAQQLVTFLGQLWETSICYIWYIWYMIHMIHMRQIRKTVGHIFGANLRHIHLLYMIHMVHDTYDTHETKSQNSWSHFWGKFETHTFVI